MTLTPEQIEEAKELCEKATEGPWVVDPYWRTSMGDTPDFSDVVKPTPETPGPRRLAQECSNDDAAFIAASRTLLPALISEVERLRRIEAAAREVDGHFAAVGQEHLTEEYIFDESGVEALAALRQALEGEGSDGS